MLEGAILVALAYLAGSMPTGVVLAGRAGVDVLRTGSGNPGATNVLRTAGRGLAALTLVLDVLKGAVPVLLARWLGEPPAIAAMTAVAAVLGHMFSVFLGFNGGKGVATGLGVVAAMAPWVVPVPLVTFVALVATTRLISLASVVAAIVAPAVFPLLGYPPESFVAALAIGVLVVTRHASNVGRILAGTEPRFGRSERTIPHGR